ncbi:1703_t:CDS:1, partial [Racocetra fulgida]
MIELLEPILVATELLSSSSYSTISNICLTFLGLLYHLNKFIDEELYLIEQYAIAIAIRSKLNKYWSIFEKSTTIVLILNSLSKLMTFLFGDQKDAALTSLQNA